ncbi:MAG: ArsR/SmtB family transcription factor [Phycicoccus sp.]
MEPTLLDERLRALAHADRRLFLALCRDEHRSAGELAERSRLSAATVSEHLKVLRKTGLLVLDRRGRFWFYRTDVAVLGSTLREALESASGRTGRG